MTEFLHYRWTRRSRNSGFQIPELLVSMGLLAVISVFGYRALKSHVGTQAQEQAIQNYDRQTIQAISKIHADLAAMDSTWWTQGQPPVSWWAKDWWMPSNTEPASPQELTFPIKAHDYSQLLRLSSSLPVGFALEADEIPLEPTPDTDSLREGDWMLVMNERSVRLLRLKQKQVVDGAIASLFLEKGEMSDYYSIQFHGGILPLTIPEMGDDMGWTKENTVIQKVNLVHYELAPLKEEGKTRMFLTRVEGGRAKGTRTYLVPADSLRFRFDYSAIRGEQDLAALDLPKPRLSPISGSIDWRGLSAIRVTFEHSKDFRKEGQQSANPKVVSFKHSFSGSDLAFRTAPGSVDAVNAGSVEPNALLGKPTLETYPDNTSYVIFPLVTFGESATSGSKGEVRINDARTGNQIGQIYTNQLTLNGTPLLPSTIIPLGETSDTSPGLLVGGYREDQNGERIPTLGFIPRDSTTRKIKYNEVVPTLQGLSNGSGLKDTASVAVVGDHIYVASFTKSTQEEDLSIVRTTFANQSFSTPVEEYRNTNGINRQITALGKGPKIRGKDSLLICESPSAYGEDDGRLKMAVVEEDGSLGPARTIANLDWNCKGVSADIGGNILVGGRLTVKIVPSTLVNVIAEHDTDLNTSLSLDDSMPAGDGKIYYASFNATTGQTIKWIQGVYLNQDLALENQLALTNLQGFVQGARHSNTVNDLLVTNIFNQGSQAHLMGSIDRDVKNINASKVSLAFVKGGQNSPSKSYPPGQYSSAGLSDKPYEVCPKDRPLVSTSDWYVCYAQKWGTVPDGYVPPDDGSDDGPVLIGGN